MLVLITSLKRFQIEFNIYNPDAVISIVDPQMCNPILTKDVPNLQMNFHDICFEPFSSYDKEKYKRPTRDDVDEIFHFGATRYKKGTKLLTHCYAGISRSSAAAIIALCPHYGYRDAVKIISDIDVFQSEDLYKKGKSHFMPNNLMIKYADERLALDGDLISMVENTFEY